MAEKDKIKEDCEGGSWMKQLRCMAATARVMPKNVFSDNTFSFSMTKDIKSFWWGTLRKLTFAAFLYALNIEVVLQKRDDATKWAQAVAMTTVFGGDNMNLFWLQLGRVDSKLERGGVARYVPTELFVWFCDMVKRSFSDGDNWSSIWTLYRVQFRISPGTDADQRQSSCASASCAHRNPKGTECG